MVRALLLSTSRTFAAPRPLDHAMPAVRAFLEGVRELVFVPFALRDRAGYTARIAARLAEEGIRVRGLTPHGEGRRVLQDAEAVFVGGGNTFRLLKAMQDADLLDPLGERVRAGLRYMGASAGSNLAGPTIMTTNDMPIVQPAGFLALGLVPFQINPHYVDPDPASRHMGETREERLREYLEENDRVVVGLREGSWLEVEDAQSTLRGPHTARVFQRDREPREAEPDTVLA